ncbi:hypothetical protein ACDX78_13305 [Virgibacillus oceani]
MKKGILGIVSAVFLLLGIFLIGIFITSFFSSYYPFSFEKSEAVIGAKESEIRLSFFPEYYAYTLNEIDGDVIRQRVSKNDIVSTPVGDTISGYEVNGGFVTNRQILLDVIHLILFSAAGILLIMLGLMIIFRNADWMYDLRLWAGTVRRRMPANTLKSVKYLLLTACVIFIFGGYILHFFQIHFSQQEEVKAEIAAVERKPGYGRFNGPTHSFTLNYEVGEEWLQANVKVTKEVFDTYREGSSLTIFYKQNNPYYVFLPSELTFNMN